LLTIGLDPLGSTIGYFSLARAFATSRTQSMKSRATGGGKLDNAKGAAHDVAGEAKDAFRNANKTP
jgi:hypothetical protein